jgi:DNA-binding SARP family transcriptional activator
MQRIEFRVLGPFEVSMEGRALELRRRKQRALLALLLLHAGEVVSTDRLIEELWAGRPPKAAVGSLQNLISDLRKALGRDLVRTRQPGYVLDVEPEQVDLHRFERLVAQASEGGDAQRRSELLREALSLWRGPPLADLAFEPFAHVEAARLEELRTAAREELIDAELELGRHSQLVGELEGLVAENPLRERLRGQLMLALYRSGRQAEALEAYRRARETLVDELGIDPSPELQRLEQSILRHDAELDLPAAPISTEQPTGERRKTATVLFADIVDSTSFATALDPEVLRAVMRRYFDTVRTIVERHGGTIEKFMGEAAMAVFGVPQMHEEDALRAVRAARDLREALIALNSELGREHALELRVRIGINTGEVLTGDAEAGQPFATGAAVTVAMRLQHAALPGETLLSAPTRALVGEGAEVEPIEPIDAGGTHDPIQAFRLLAVDEGAPLRGLSNAAFIGRQGELEALETAFRAVRDERRSRTLIVLGEAGVGKTRLASELVASLGERASALVGRCVSYGEGATYLPLAEIVREVAPERPQATIERLLEGDEHAAVVAERIAELTGQTEGTAPTGELFWAVRQLFEGLARRSPLVVVLEDLHWAEPTLLDLVEYLAAWPVETPLFLVCLARPELRDERPGLGAEAEVLRLEPLEEAAIDLLVGELGGAEIGAEARRRIASLAEGNPLFVEQLVAFLEEAGPEALESVPPSVEALLASRLDRLETGDRVLLERAAVAGREFSRGAVVHLTPPDELTGIDRRLRSLAGRSLLREVRGEDDALRFQHVLIRDVAYSAITKERRADLHERYGSWLDARNEPDELVGYHAEQAHTYQNELHPGDPAVGRLASWAGERLAAAGIRAWKRADTPASVNLLGRAVALLPAESEERATLLCELGVAQRWAGELEVAETTFADAIAAASGDPRIALRAKVELAHAHLFRDPAHGAHELLELAERAIPVFEELGDDRALGRTWRHIGYVRGGMQCRNRDWEQAAEKALVHYRRAGWSAAGCLAELAAALFFGPTPVPDAIRRCDELLEQATDMAGRANVLVYKGGLEALAGRFDAGRSAIAEASSTYQEIGEVYALANNSGRILGRVELIAGDYAAADIALRESCETLERFHDWAGLSTSSADLAQALYGRDRGEEAKAWAERAESRARTDDLSAQFSWRAIRAKLEAQAGNLEEGTKLGFEALQIVERTDALTQHGEVLLDLAQVLSLAHRLEEAVDGVESALKLFSRKGNVSSAERARTLLSGIAVAGR